MIARDHSDDTTHAAQARRPTYEWGYLDGLNGSPIASEVGAYRLGHEAGASRLMATEKRV